MTKKVEKIPSGIPGFDEISHGGIPKGRVTLISGTSGSGKTVFSAQFIYKGIVDYGENGVFVTFEESPTDIIMNMKSFGWDIEKLQKENRLVFVDASPDDSEVIESGQYDLGAFLSRIRYAIEKVNAKRVAIDSISAIFAHYQAPGIIRRELYRLAFMLKKMSVTCIITAERITEEGPITRFEIEEFVSDNVILLHNRLNKRSERERTIEILKYRGSTHESNEVPLIVNKKGVVVYPRPKPQLRGKGFTQKISTGIKELDKLLYGGIYRNSTTLVSGASGTGKTVTALHFIMEGVKKKEKCLLIEFEESQDQLYKNASSFGWNLKKYVKEEIVQLICHYPEDLKAEQYFKIIQDMVINSKAKRVALDSR